jgi:hypothetical protein
MSWSRVLAGVAVSLALAAGSAGCSAPFSHKGTPACQAGLPELRARLDTLDRQMVVERRRSRSMARTVARASAGLRAIDRKYPGRALPPKVYDRYVALQRSYNRLYRSYSAQVARTNRAISRRNAIATRYNRTLRCSS